MSKILVVGGAGYIGGLTTNKLVKAGHNVTVFDKLLYESRYLKKINFAYGDIRDTDAVIAAAKDMNVVVLMAALVGDPACAVNPILSEEINFLAIKEICEYLPPEVHVIFMSTCSVYGAQDGVLNEDSPTSPLSVYASTKLRAERYVRERNGTIFRLGTVFGMGDTHSRIRMDLVVNVLTMKAFIRGKIAINGGEQWRPIIAVKDIANYITEAVTEKPVGTFIIAKENVTMKQLGERVCAALPNTIIEYNDIPFQDARNYNVSTEKALCVFRYRPIITVEDEVLRMWKMFTEQRIKNPEDLLYNNGVYLSELHKNNNLI
jgi:nucleoside-diphosphate-sugar epimerase